MFRYSKSLPEKISVTIPEAASTRYLEFIIHHASRKQLTQRLIADAQHYSRDLKYPRGSLVYESDEENDFLYCLPDSNEIDVYREMMDTMSYPKLELGLSLMPKDHMADCFVLNLLIKVFTCVSTLQMF
jgi:hypothetical protein